jgi:hypothetical protein
MTDGFKKALNYVKWTKDKRRKSIFNNIFSTDDMIFTTDTFSASICKVNRELIEKYRDIYEIKERREHLIVLLKLIGDIDVEINLTKDIKDKINDIENITKERRIKLKGEQDKLLINNIYTLTAKGLNCKYYQEVDIVKLKMLIKDNDMLGLKQENYSNTLVAWKLGHEHKRLIMPLRIN